MNAFACPFSSTRERAPVLLSPKGQLNTCWAVCRNNAGTLEPQGGPLAVLDRLARKVEAEHVQFAIHPGHVLQHLQGKTGTR